MQNYSYPEFTRTEIAHSRLIREAKGLYKPPNRLNRIISRIKGDRSYGKYLDRHIIGMDSRIAEGVSIGAGNREAITVSWNYHRGYDVLPKLLIQIKDKFDGFVRKHPNLTKEQAAMSIVFDIASDVFPPKGRDESLINNFLNKYSKDLSDKTGVKINLSRDHKVALDNFANEHIGVCIHVALLTGALLEKMVDLKMIEGKVSIDRNTVISEKYGEKVSHAWARFTTKQGEVYVVDPMLLNKPMMLRDAVLQADHGSGYPYNRPQDKMGSSIDSR